MTENRIKVNSNQNKFKSLWTIYLLSLTLDKMMNERLIQECIDGPASMVPLFFEFPGSILDYLDDLGELLVKIRNDDYDFYDYLDHFLALKYGVKLIFHGEDYRWISVPPYMV